MFLPSYLPLLIFFFLYIFITRKLSSLCYTHIHRILIGLDLYADDMFGNK